MTKKPFTVFADYHQFYLWDKDQNPEAPIDYSDEDIRNRIKVAPFTVVVMPLRNTTVSVELEVLVKGPTEDFSEWDHIVQCGIDVPSGNLQVHECTGGPVAEVPIEPGCYVARVYFGQLDTVSDDGFNGEDRYRIVLWPGQLGEVEVLKEWKP